VLPRHGSFYHRNAKDCITRFFKKRELSRDFVSSSRMTSNQEVTIRLVLCAVGVPDFTGVEDIFPMTVGQSRTQRRTALRISVGVSYMLTPNT
jgi:hypothetical protein